MKKLSILLFLLFSCSFIFSENTSFELFLSKPGVNDYYFCKRGDKDSPINETDEITFKSIQDKNTKESTVSFGFYWSLYVDGNISMEMEFKSKSTSSLENDFMLLHTKNDDVGLNYTVSWASDDNSSSGNINPTSINSKISKNERTIQFLSSTPCDDITGIKGLMNFDCILNAPTNDDGKYFMEGQYSGVAQVKIMIS